MDSETIVSKVLESHAENMNRLEGIAKKRTAFHKLAPIVKEEEYFLGIAGLRGIGKTILLLQMARENNGVYVSADNRNLRGVDIFDIIKSLSSAGHVKIFIDEIHSKPGWDADLKTAYDENLAHVSFTGSSALELQTLKADLSRRVVMEHLKPASFREWMEIKKDLTLPLLTLDELISAKADLTRKHAAAAKFLSEYYKTGGVLYEAKTMFYKTILSTIETIAAKDFTAVKTAQDTQENFFKLLLLIARSKPLELSYSKIGETMGKDKVWVMRFLSNVEKTDAIKRVYPTGSGLSNFRKEAKYYLPFPYRSALCESQAGKPDAGILREEFFANHVECTYVKNKQAPDFTVNGKTFEIGGQNKNNKQNADYLVTDSLDTTKNKIPLFLTGTLY